MDRMNFGEGFLCGCLVVSVVLVFAFTWVRDQGRDECDNKLPRTEKCVQIWVPEKAIKKGDTP